MTSVLDRAGKWRANMAVSQPAARTVLVIVMLVAVLGIGILAAFLGARMGDEEAPECVDKCNPGSVEKGWKAFSITVIALGIPLLVVFFLFFGCTTKTG